MTNFVRTDAGAVVQTFPIDFQWQTRDPFLFCAYHRDAYPRGNADMGPAADLSGRNLGQDFVLKDGFRMYHGERVPGFPHHPHRGFETITIVRTGFVDHADSMAAAGRYGAGDVQWMTAGRGIQHSEMFPLLSEKEANPLELFQVWLNLPRARKMVEPHYTMFWRDQVPRHSADGVVIDMVAGPYANASMPKPPPESWASDPDHHVAVWVISMNPGGRMTLPPTLHGINRTLYFYKGDTVSFGGRTISRGTALDLAPTLPLSLENTGSEAGLLLLQGRPIGEPVAQHGPFVMTTKDEILQTIADYRRTQFGGWPWKRSDMVHDRFEGRFALHPGGRREVPE